MNMLYYCTANTQYSKNVYQTCTGRNLIGKIRTDLTTPIQLNTLSPEKQTHTF